MIAGARDIKNVIRRIPFIGAGVWLFKLGGAITTEELQKNGEGKVEKVKTTNGHELTQIETSSPCASPFPQFYLVQLCISPFKCFSISAFSIYHALDLGDSSRERDFIWNRVCRGADFARDPGPPMAPFGDRALDRAGTTGLCARYGAFVA